MGERTFGSAPRHLLGGRRHQRDTLWSQSVAIFSRLAEPERSAVEWTARRPEVLVLPMIAFVMWLADARLAALFTLAAGLIVGVIVALEDANRWVGSALAEITPAPVLPVLSTLPDDVGDLLDGVAEAVFDTTDTVPMHLFWISTEDWDVAWHRIRQDALNDGYGQGLAKEIADREAELEFGPRPAGPEGGDDRG